MSCVCICLLHDAQSVFVDSETVYFQIFGGRVLHIWSKSESSHSILQQHVVLGFAKSTCCELLKLIKVFAVRPQFIGATRRVKIQNREVLLCAACVGS